MEITALLKLLTPLFIFGAACVFYMMGKADMLTEISQLLSEDNNYKDFHKASREKRAEIKKQLKESKKRRWG